ncbi:hypothetical protein CCR84_09450 [Rhodocyclus purpureus]|nr:hypothetical protein [Rhodocyclus purpureus]
MAATEERRFGMGRQFWIAIAFSLLLGWLPLLHAEPPSAPLLRIETGSHLALITRVSSDRAGRWLLTSSEDKTARLWDAASGDLISVLRPPIGVGSLGALYASALSPDGKLAALGGNSGFTPNSHSLYLFDRASGRLPAKSTVSGLEAPITQLAWSRDSTLIAVGLRQEGLRVFTRTLDFVGSDPEYNEAVYGADFAADGRLVTASPDGGLRLYATADGRLRRIARQRMPGKPYAVAFSPDGSMIAVGYQNLARVDVLSGSDLDLLHSATVAGNGNLGRVVWARDGRVLFAGGTARSHDRFTLYAIPGAGRGSPREIGAFANIIVALAPLRDGVAAVTAEPSWASFDAVGHPLLKVTAQGADFRDTGKDFKLSADGLSVAFPMARGKGGPLLFDGARGELRADSRAELPPHSSTAKLSAPRLPEEAHLPLSDWRNSTNPKFGALALPLAPGDVSHSVAVSADRSRFVLGSEWFLRAFDRHGSALWEQRTPGAVWAVNVSDDGRWAVAALGDGTIRWFRMEDGREEMALFVHADRKRWILWTPAGYYDTSPGGEDLIGWHLNRGYNQAADFFSVGRFRDRFYRPDILRHTLRIGDEVEAISLAQSERGEPLATAAGRAAARSSPPPRPGVVSGQGGGAAVAKILPPVIELQSDGLVETTERSVPVRFRLRSPADAPVTEVKVRVNDKLEQTLSENALRGIRGESHEIQVSVPPGDGEIRLYAANRNAKSEAAVVRVRRSAVPGKLPSVRYEKLYSLIVGISQYPGDWALELSDKDARDFHQHMAGQAGKLYGQSISRLLLNQDATRGKILEGLAWLRKSVGEKDAGMLFLAGHGDTVGGAYYFIPGDPGALPAHAGVGGSQEFEDWKAKNAAQRWVSGDEIARTLLGLKGRAAFFIDTCHSGITARPGQSTNPDLTRALNEINEERGVIVFASSAGRELSQESREWGNGAFTKAIIEGIRGKADLRNDGLIRPTLLQAYVTDRVRELTDNKQRPVMFNVGIDDPIAVRSP